MAERLALEGGPPVRSTPLPYGRQWVDDEDIRAVTEVLRSDWLTTGPAVTALEAALAARLGAREAVVLANGTAALHAAVAAAGLGPGDEVIVPPITFAASANCVLYRGARPVFADVAPDTLNLDPAAAAAAVTDRSRALIVVHYGGQPAELDALRALAEARGLVLIEDACHALGATYHGQPVGATSDLATFSFHPVKHITTGEGGAVVTGRAGWAERMRHFRNHGITRDHRQRAEAGGWVYEMVELGYNYRLPDLNCALGLSQLRHLDAWLARRREIAGQLAAGLADLPAMAPLARRPEREAAWHLFPVLLDLERLRVGRAQVFAALRAEGIGVNVHYIPVYWHPYYQGLGYPRGLCPVAEAAYERLLTLPLFPAMTDADVADVLAAVAKVAAAYAA